VRLRPTTHRDSTALRSGFAPHFVCAHLALSVTSHSLYLPPAAVVFSSLTGEMNPPYSLSLTRLRRAQRPAL